MADKMPVLSLNGPRQSGKSTLVRTLFADHRYVSLESPDALRFSQEDPRGFLGDGNAPLIIDEAQNNPELFSYIQSIVDQSGKMGNFILTGSQNFLLLEKISQSLAGRVALFTLLPFSINELEGTDYAQTDLDSCIFNGLYPRLYDHSIEPSDYYPSYIQTYVERDVRQLINISDLGLFQSFLRLCAGRIGQPINYSGLANEAGISDKTAKSWISLLEASFIVFQHKPYFKNFGKRILKSGKLYFYDTGLAASLLGLRSKDDLALHFSRGTLFENLMITELMKAELANGHKPQFYFWNEQGRNEVDLLIDRGIDIVPVELKSGATVNSSWLNALSHFNEVANRSEDQPSYLVYGGATEQHRTACTVLGWKRVLEIMES